MIPRTEFQFSRIKETPTVNNFFAIKYPGWKKAMERYIHHRVSDLDKALDMSDSGDFKIDFIKEVYGGNWVYVYDTSDYVSELVPNRRKFKKYEKYFTPQKWSLLGMKDDEEFS